MSKRLLASVFMLAAPALALAQPGEPPGNPGGAPGPGPTGPAAADDEARIKEVVDREVARILTERAAKEAADKAAKENAEKEAASEKATDLSGQSGVNDVRLAFTVTNENMLVKPGETIPSAPGWHFGTPNSLGVLFFDNYDTRYSGFETLSHITAYRTYSLGHVQAEGGLVLRFNEINGETIPVSDDGSYITLTNWKDPAHKDPTRISFTVFPVSADRLRLGYSYRLSWGGNPEFRRDQQTATAPGVKLQYDFANGYLFVGGKSALELDPADGERKASLAGLAGGGVDVNDMVRLEVNGGIFDRGKNELQDVDDQHVVLYGGSGQISIHKGTPLRSSVDYKLYKFNGEQVSQLFSPEKYPGGLSWSAQSELTVLGQTLKDPDKTGSTVNQIGKAGDLNVRVKIDRVRLRADVSYRDLAFILHSQPSLPPYSDFPDAYKTSPNLFAAAGLDKNWDDWLTLGVIVGVDKPATLKSPKGIPGATTDATGDSTAVIRNNNIDTLITILPAGEKAVPQVAVKGTAKIDFAKVFSAVLDVFYSYDGNQTQYRRTCTDPDTCPFEYVFGKFNQLGVNATLQARF